MPNPKYNPEKETPTPELVIYQLGELKSGVAQLLAAMENLANKTEARLLALELWKESVANIKKAFDEDRLVYKKDLEDFKKLYWIVTSGIVVAIVGALSKLILKI